MTIKRILAACALGAIAGYASGFLLYYYIFDETLSESLISPIFVAVYSFIAFFIVKYRERKRSLKTTAK